MKQSVVLSSLLVSASLAACSAAEMSGSVERNEIEDVSTAQQGEALSVSPPVSQFVLLARQGASFNGRSLVQGANLGVGPGSGGVQNTLSAGGSSTIGVGFDSLAQRVVLGDRSTAGNLDLTAYVPGTGVTTGTRTAYVAPVAVPTPTSATVGTTNVTVNSGSTQPLAPGRYNNITVNGILNLTGGLYEARSLTVNNDARVVAQAHSVVRLLTGVSALDRSQLTTVSSLSASDLTIEASGGLVNNTTLGVSLGNDARLKAIVVASRGLRAGDRLLATGAIAAQSVTTGFDTSLSFQGGFGCASDAECGDGANCSGTCIDAQCQLPASCSVVSIAPGSDLACAVLADGTASCWGDNGSGDLGHGDIDPVFGTPAFPTKVGPAPVVTALVGPKLTNVHAVDVGGTTSCAALDDGSVWCWGHVPGMSNSNIAVQVPGFSGVTAISVAGFGICGLLTDSSVSCMDWSGAVTATGITSATAISVSDSYACALISGGTVTCWGNNGSGQLGDGGTTATPAPGVSVQLATNDVAVSITTSPITACAALSSGTVKCWGSNDNGQMGNNVAPGTPSLPVPVINLQDAVQVGGGTNQMCAVRRNGSVECWGQNSAGQCGDGTFTSILPQPSPDHAVRGLSNARQVGAGQSFACAVARDGRAYCWGNDGDATLGDGSGDLPNQSSAVRVLL